MTHRFKANQSKTNANLKAILDANIPKIEKFGMENSISIFTELEVIKQLKVSHARVCGPEELSQSPPNSQAEIVPLPPDTMYLLNFRSQLQFTRILCSFFAQLMSQVKKNSYSLYYEMTSFFLYEYKNWVAALISLYQMLYSSRYQRESNIFQKIMIENYIELSSCEVDYSRVLSFGKFIQEKTVENQLLINSMMKQFSSNVKLINECVFFELCVLERQTLTQRTKKAYQELKSEGRLYKNASKFTRGKEKSSMYNTLNSIVFANCLDHNFKVAIHSSNAPSFFKYPDGQFLGVPIKALMPKFIGMHHNQFIFEFINGNSRSKSHGKFDSAAKLGGTLGLTIDGTLKGVTIIPKFEFLYLDCVYVGALIIADSQASRLVIFADDTGCILGGNSMVVLDKERLRISSHQNN